MSKVDSALAMSTNESKLKSLSIDDLDALLNQAKNELEGNYNLEDDGFSTVEIPSIDSDNIEMDELDEETGEEIVEEYEEASIGELEENDATLEGTSYDEESLLTEEELAKKADDYGTSIDASELNKVPEGVDENKVVSQSLSDDTWGRMVSASGDFVVQEKDGENFQLRYVDIQNITIIKRIRNSETDVNSLVRSIRSTGLLEPIVVAPLVTDGKFLLIHGYRRIVACARAGLRKLPCIVNQKIKTTDIQVLEAMYNHHRNYSIQEQIDYIDYLEKEKGILSASMIEFLLQMNSGDYAKLKDILNDNDADIVSKLLNGTYTIEQAFRKLEARRKKETKAEQEAQKAEKVYAEGEVQENLQDKGQEADETSLTDEEISAIAVRADQIDDGIEDASLEEMVANSDDLEGFEVKHQEVGNREPLSKEKRKAIIARDKGTCQCCKNNGENNPEEWADVLDVHHIIPVFLDTQGSTDGGDRDSNLITVCFNCHKRIHLFSYGDLTISRPKTEEEIAALSEEEKVIYKRQRDTLKRIVKLGNVIRAGMVQKKIKKEQAKKEHPIHRIGRNMPGKGTQNPDV